MAAMTVQEELQEQLKYSGLLPWYERGITGKRITIWNMENGKGDHGQMTIIRVKHAAPDAEVINASLSMSSDNKGVKYVNTKLDDNWR